MRVLLTGGGTGGHIYPAIALMRRLREVQPDTEFLYVGTDRGLESKLVPDYGIMFQSVRIEGFRRQLNLKGIQYNINTIRLFLKSIRESKKIIQEFKPDVVVGTGGYVCAPVCYAAAKKGIPTIIHEQNSVPGITNKFLARYVDKIAICFDEAADRFKGHEEKVVFTGNPRAQEVSSVVAGGELTQYGLDPEKDTVLIFGGSRGAQKINEAFIEAYEDLSKKEYQVLFVSGSIYYNKILDELTSRYGQNFQSETIKIEPYIKDMPKILAGVSLVVGRSGATSLAELTALGIPSVLIPSPNVTEDHQTKNALSLVKKDAAVMIKENELTNMHLVSTIDHLMDDKANRKYMSEKARIISRPKASDDLIQVMLDVIKEKHLSL